MVNVQCYKDRTVEFTGKDVVVMPNGGGKTTLLDSIGIGIMGKHPRLGKSPEHIINMMPEEQDHMVLVLRMGNGAEIRREYERKKGKSQTIIINGKTYKVKEGEEEISKMFSDKTGKLFIVRFRPAILMNKTELEMKKYLWNIFSDKLSGKHLRTVRKTFINEIYRLHKGYESILRILFGTKYSDLKEEQQNVLFEKMYDELCVNGYQIVMDDILNIVDKIPETPVPEWLEELTNRINKYKNDSQRDKESTKKAKQKLMEDQEIVDGIPAKTTELRKLRQERDDFKVLKTIHSNKQEALILYNQAMIELEVISVDENKLKRMKEELKKKKNILDLKTYLDSQMSELNGQKVILQPQIDKLLKKRDIQNNIDQEKRKKLVEVNKIDSITIKAKNASKKMDAVDKKIISLNKKLESIKNNYQAINVKITNLSSSIDTLKETIQLFEDGKCPTCETPVKDIKIDLSGIIRKKDEKVIEVESLKKNKIELSKKIENHESSIKKLEVEKKKYYEGIITNNALLDNAISNEQNYAANINKWNEEIDALGKISLTDEEYDKMVSKLHEIKNKREQNKDEINSVQQLLSDISVIEQIKLDNKEKINKRKKMEKPEVPDIDENIDNAIESLDLQINQIEEYLENAREKIGIEKKIAELGEEYDEKEANTKFVTQIELTLAEYKQRMIKKFLSPIANMANKIYSKIYAGEIVFTGDKCGIRVGKNYISYRHLSDGEKVAFSTSLIFCIADEINVKEKMMLIEGNELDSLSLSKMLEALSLIKMENVIVTTFSKETVNRTTIPKGWNIIT